MKGSQPSGELALPDQRNPSQQSKLQYAIKSYLEKNEKSSEIIPGAIKALSDTRFAALILSPFLY